MQQDKAPVQDSIKSSLDEIAVADIQKPSVSPRVAPASAAGNNAVKADEKMIISGKESAKQNNNEATLFKQQANTKSGK